MRLGLGRWLVLAAQFRSQRGVGALAVEGRMLAGEPAAGIVLAAFLLTVLGALALALVPRAGVRELAPRTAANAGRERALASTRLVIESVFSNLKGQMRLEQHLPKTPAGLAVRRDTEHGEMTVRRWSPQLGYREAKRSYP